MCIRDRALPGVDSAILDPRDTYADKAQWEAKAKDLAGRFVKNFEKYADVYKRQIQGLPI